MQTSPLRFLPIAIVLLAISVAIAFGWQRQTVKNKLNILLNSKSSISLKSADPTPYLPPRQFKYETVSPTPTPRSSKSEDLAETGVKAGSTTPTPKKDQTVESKTLADKTTKTRVETATSNIVCTPVYGMANTCAEHAVVDTAGLADVFPSLAIGSYFAGLVAFIKAKRA